jgi:hypothetical protein
MSTTSIEQSQHVEKLKREQVERDREAQRRFSFVDWGIGWDWRRMTVGLDLCHEQKHDRVFANGRVVEHVPEGFHLLVTPLPFVLIHFYWTKGH